MTALTVLLTGCATTIRSDVTAFHDWPAQLNDKSYVFEAPAAEDDTLEYRSYQNLVRAELAKHGFGEASGPDAAKLRVAMSFGTTDIAERVLQATDPFWYGPGYWPGRYGYRYGAWPGYGRFGYSPFWGGPMEVEESVRFKFDRKLRITINERSGRKLYDVSVHSTSGKRATPQVMPAMVASAFADFPGRSGVPRQVEVQVQ
ncbi:DUF4136 domain-containing protein [Janthinobacterium sp.]|uniref:DUF4136 domain-containing protein n=1 Tax=Janthinobacterium sp. TaxID=1871054 RepID=UPI00289F1B11|nr:DUF4136 domain-containing protein [Janthinobacterium sp.]